MPCATGAEHEGGRVSALKTRVGLRDSTPRCRLGRARNGRFAASGGLELDSRWRARETALGLPLTGMPEWGRGALPSRRLRRPPDGSRLVWRSTPELRPVDAAGYGSTRTSWSPGRRRPGRAMAREERRRAEPVHRLPRGGARARGIDPRRLPGADRGPPATAMAVHDAHAARSATSCVVLSTIASSTRLARSSARSPT